jgi:hypothetical protein
LSASLNTTAIFSIFIDLEHQSYQFKNYADGVLACLEFLRNPLF